VRLLRPVRGNAPNSATSICCGLVVDLPKCCGFVVDLLMSVTFRRRGFIVGIRFVADLLRISCVYNNSTNRSFYRAANSTFGKIGRIASEDVLIELPKTKCMPVLLYGFEVCNLCKRDLYSLDFVVNKFFNEII